MANILIVEDYQSLQEVYYAAFKNQKHTVKLANNGADGLKQAKNEHFDFILLDLLMPQSDGFAFLRDYNAKRHPETQIIILSNLYTTDLLNKALKLGASNYLLKSDVTPQQLVDLVQQMIEQRKATTA